MLYLVSFEVTFYIKLPLYLQKPYRFFSEWRRRILGFFCLPLWLGSPSTPHTLSSRCPANLILYCYPVALAELGFLEGNMMIVHCTSDTMMN